MHVFRKIFAFKLAPLVFLALLMACPKPEDPSAADALVGDAFAGVLPIDAVSLKLYFRVAIEAESVKPQAFSLTDFTQIPPVQLSVAEVARNDPYELSIRTAPQQAGAIYTLWVRGLRDVDGNAVEGSINFVGVGGQAVAPLRFRVLDTDQAARYGALTLWLNVDDAGRFVASGGSRYPLSSGDEAWQAEVDVAVAPSRSVTRADDADSVIDRRAYMARLYAADGRSVSPLVPFAVDDDSPQVIDLPLLAETLRCPDAPVPELALGEPPSDDNPGDGLSPVRIVIDDRQARELINPALSLTLDDSGHFDLNERQVSLQELETAGLWEVTLNIAVDPSRDNVDIATAPVEALPVIAFLVNDGIQRNDFYTFIPVLTEAGQNIVMPLGAPGLVPVTLRVDARDAFLTADGSQRGLYAGEALFITGNFVNIVDAFGQNCADSWSGGENLNLRMHQDPDRAGLWQKTLWMPPGRAQSFKVLRCDAQTGCGPLNARVTSTGYAFVSVAKNLVTENRDARDHSEVRVVDPANLHDVTITGQSYDYSNADIYQGSASGREDNPSGLPNPSLLFKQEMPNLVVNLLNTGDCPAQSPVYVVGTWRDINLPKTPSEILQDIAVGDTPLNLSPYDYDDGMVGVTALTRELP